MALCGKIPEDLHKFDAVKLKVKLTPNENDGKRHAALVFVN